MIIGEPLREYDVEPLEPISPSDDSESQSVHPEPEPDNEEVQA